MVLCLQWAPDALFLRNPGLKSTSKSRVRFDSQEALIYLEKCSNFKQLKQIHARVIRFGISYDQLLIRKILNLCSCYGKMKYGTLVFNQIQNPEIITWNVMIRAHTTDGSSKAAQFLFKVMVCQGVAPDKFTFPFVVKACTDACAIDLGQMVHALAIKTGFSGDVYVQNTLMDLYFKCENIDCAYKVFEKMCLRNVVSWTTMIAGLVASGQLGAARGVFEQMPTKNVVSWTAMIDGYVKNQQPEEAFQLFWKMQLYNVRPNEFTMVSLVKVCAETGSLKLGRWIHDFALKNGFELGAFLGTALIDMYSKCGSASDARTVFNHMKTKSSATWNSMITSLGVHGFGKEALALFKEMEKEDVDPDAITFVGVLSACVHINDLEKAQKYFTYMTEHYEITPLLEHYTCLIELYRRANRLDEICPLMKSLEVKQNDRNLSAVMGRSRFLP